MILIALALITLASCTALIAAGLKNALLEGSLKAFSSGSYLFFAYVMNVYCLDTFIFQKVQESIINSGSYSLFGASNHFIMTLDIIYLLSAILLVFYHKLKITIIPSVIKSI